MVWVHIVGAVTGLGGVAVASYLLRNRVPLSPRQVREQSRWTTPFSVAVFLALAVFNWVHGLQVMAGIMALLMLVTAAWALVGHLRSPRRTEELLNFAVERGRCGRCGYDLTGNVSGICPECGWEIPQGELDVDSPGWMLWWRKWEIEHLRNWRRTLLFLAPMILCIVFMCTLMAIALGPGAVVLPAAMSISFGINFWRVVVYARRHRHGTR